MTKEEFLAMSLPYGLVIQGQDGYTIELKSLGMASKECNISSNLKFDTVKPILHPLSDLTKPITHKGEKFVPIERIKEIFHISIDYRKFTNRAGWSISEDKFIIINYDEDVQINIINHLNIIQKLIEWHFNLMDESEPFVDVNTLPVNPYA